MTLLYLMQLVDSDVSRQSGISISAYLRTSPSSVTGENHPDMGNDILLARVDLSPPLDTPVSPYVRCHPPVF